VPRSLHFILLCLSAGWLFAADGGVAVTDVWSRATTPGAAAAVVYLRLANRSEHTVTIQGIETPVAARAHIHRTVADEGLTKMVPVAELSLAPGEEAEFKPGGLHVMLMGLKRPLVEGSTFPVSLKLHQTPDLQIEVLVGAIGQMTAP